MKRTIAWALLFLILLGATPALAAAPLRDVSDLGRDGTVTTAADTSGTDADPTADADPDASVSPAAETDSETGSVYAPNHSIVSVSGRTGAESASPSSAGSTSPVAENQQIETYRGVSVGGKLTAHDPDGDDLTFEIATEPMKGTVNLSPDGTFVYTPKEGKRGKDYFGFRATDSAGNTSQEGTVIIKLIKQKSKVTYSDLTGNGSEYAAVVLTENGVFTGEYVGDDYVFNPDAEVTRGEFLTMCMTAAGCDLLKGVSSTGFRDDGEIGQWLKPYVATALMNGYIQGQSGISGATFDPAETITIREACVTLNSVLGVTDVVSAAAYVGEANSRESWAQAVANLTACGVMMRNWEDVEAVLTRAGAAELLANAIGLVGGK